MTWSDELTRIRRYLRDPAGNIWSDDLLLTIYNDVQKELAHQTGILEEVIALRVPPLYQWSYMYDHEWNQLPTTNSQFYQALHYHHQSQAVICYDWEGQQLNKIGTAQAEVGTRFTHPWEAFTSIIPGDLVPFRFPNNFDTLKFITYDREPVYYRPRKDIEKRDSSYITTEGQPLYYYRQDDLDNSFIAYPLPNTAWTDELVGGESGMVLFGPGDTVDSDTGTIILRDGTLLQTQTGVAVDLIDFDNSFLIGYDIAPNDLVEWSDESDFPDYLQKYIEYGVLARAYRVNNDGNIPSLADYWQYRYDFGVQLMNKFKYKRMQDRDYKLGTQTLVRRRKNHPRLPSHYPPCP